MSNLKLVSGSLLCPWATLRKIVSGHPTVFFGFNTTWWTCHREHLYRKEWTAGPPSGPRGEMLMETDAIQFLQAAEANPKQYGRHGLEALAAAFNGHIRVASGPKENYPTSVETWDQVNDLIDAAEQSKERGNG